MKSNIAIGDEERSGWINRICRRVQENLVELDYSCVVLSCSALTRKIRWTIRGDLRDKGLKVVFVDLQADLETLKRRLEDRKGHYMGAAMAEGQANLYETPGLDEIDVFPVDAVVEESGVLNEIQ